MLVFTISMNSRYQVASHHMPLHCYHLLSKLGHHKHAPRVAQNGFGLSFLISKSSMFTMTPNCFSCSGFYYRFSICPESELGNTKALPRKET